MTSERKGDWIQTFTGKQYWPLDPRPEEVFIEDIAHALSMSCRFTGHCKFHYSVAQHSVLGSFKVPPKHAFQFLMHDTPEAYIADLARPVKRNVEGYADIEELNWQAISTRYAINPVMHPVVVAMDNSMLLAERNQIMAATSYDWSVPGEPADVTILSLSPETAKQNFLKRFNELYTY